MKKLSIVLVFLLICGFTFSQNPLSKGESQLNLGVGLSEWSVPFYIGFDYGVDRDITLGAELSYQHYDRWSDDYYNPNIIGISGNGNYHFNRVLNIPRKWDLYAGLNLGFYIWSYPHNRYPDSHTTGIGLGAQVGGRYFVSRKVALNLEFGGHNEFSGGKFGITIKL
jgi:hypothetical protein